jgi:hypothetical protein
MMEKINVGGVVGCIERMIILIFLKQPPPPTISTKLVPIVKHMTIVSRFI